MKKFIHVFNRISWKLAFWYTAITVGVLLLVQIVILVVGFQLLYNTPGLGGALAGLLQQAGPQLSKALDQDPPDLAALQKWMADTDNGQNITLDNGSRFKVTGTTNQDIQVVVLDRRGKVLVSGQPSAVPAGAQFNDLLPDPGKTVVDNALRGEISSRLLNARIAAQKLLLATPVFNNNGQVVGALLVRISAPNEAELLGYVASSILPSTLTFTLIVGTIGILFGLVTARGLTRRIREINQATSAWGQGKFVYQIEDRSGDELGQLGQELNHMAGELQTLVQTRQDLAAAEERNRLARDLHDSVKQQVFAISMNLGAAKSFWETNPQKARDSLEAAAGLAQQAQTELSLLIQMLRPTQLAQKGLAVALREHVQSWEHNTGIPVTCKVSDDLRLGDQVEEVLFRVAQEALSNIARHSGATAASLEIISETGSIELKINDNGRGFDAGSPSKGVGLRSMQERVQSAGGRLEVKSGPGGTQLRITIPRAMEGLVQQKEAQ